MDKEIRTKNLLGSKPIQEEHEIILDHNYDGIKELDNNTSAMVDIRAFMLQSCLRSVYLVFRFEVFKWRFNQYKELETEYAEAKIAN